MTTPNPIEEIKAIRHRLGAEAGYDIHRVFAELCGMHTLLRNVRMSISLLDELRRTM